MTLRSIRAKFTLWYAGSLLALFAAAYGISAVVFQQAVADDLDERLIASAALLEAGLSECAPPEQPEALSACFETLGHAIFPFDVVFAQLREHSDASLPLSPILAQSASLRGHVLPAADAPSFRTLPLPSLQVELRMLTRAIHPAGFPAITLQLATPVELKYAPTRFHPQALARGHLFSVTFFALLLLTPVFGYLFMKQAFAPIRALVASARRITAEDLSHRIEGVNSRDEIGELAETFNEMIARLEASFQQIRQFSGDVAHELKTPLTALKGEVEVALRHDRSPQEYRRILASALEDIDHLSRIIADLLFLARLDARTLSITFERLALDDVVLSVYERLANLAQSKGVALTVEALATVDITGDAGLITRLLTNLVVNAIRYTPIGGNVAVAVVATEDAACVTVRDTGVGIPAEALPRIFDRFYRVDQSRSHATGGSGLGLAIARKIADVHAARIEVASQVGDGTTFTVFWNRAKSESVTIMRPCAT